MTSEDPRETVSVDPVAAVDHGRRVFAGAFVGLFISFLLDPVAEATVGGGLSRGTALLVGAGIGVALVLGATYLTAARTSVELFDDRIVRTARMPVWSETTAVPYADVAFAVRQAEERADSVYVVHTGGEGPQDAAANLRLEGLTDADAVERGLNRRVPDAAARDRSTDLPAETARRLVAEALDGSDPVVVTRERVAETLAVPPEAVDASRFGLVDGVSDAGDVTADDFDRPDTDGSKGPVMAGE